MFYYWSLTCRTWWDGSGENYQGGKSGMCGGEGEILAKRGKCSPLTHTHTHTHTHINPLVEVQSALHSRMSMVTINFDKDSTKSKA